jgi:DNA-binding NarL/FixJ family response regulator
MEEMILTDIVTVQIVEDDQYIAAALSRGIGATDKFNVLPVAGTVGQALDALFNFKPRIVLVDLGLPDGTGMEVIKAAQSTDWTCDCVVLSVFGDEERVMKAIRSGARGYLLKTDKTRDIVADLKSVLDGGSPISAKVARHILAKIPSSTTTDLEECQDTPNLTPREHDILVLVSRGYKRQEIAVELGISVTTVSTHISSVYRKLDTNSNVNAVKKATGFGLL